MTISFQKTVMRLAVTLIAACAPALFTYWLITDYLDAKIERFVPHEWNDQTGLWHTALTFKEVGFNGGYYSLNEQIGRLSIARFDVKGPTYAVIYGSIAHLTGWETYSSIYVNLLLLGLALVAFVYLADLDALQAGLAGLLVVTLWVILLYIPTSSQETFHHASALMIAAFFVRLFRQGTQAAWYWKVGCLLAIFIAALMRFSWAILYLPAFFLILYLPKPSLIRLILSFVLSGILTAAALLFARYTSTPNVNSVLVSLDGILESPVGGSRDLLQVFYENANTFLNFSGYGIVTLEYLQVIGGIVVGLVLLAFAFSRHPRSRDLLGYRLEIGFHAYNLIAALAAAFAVYLPAGYFRFLGIHLLISLLVLLALRHYRWIAVILVMNLTVLPNFLTTYRTWRANFEFDPIQMEDYREAMVSYLVYDPAAPSPWCNTLLLPLDYYDYRVTLIPGGIGISWLWDLKGERAFHPPVRSHYLLMDKAGFEHFQARVGSLNAEWVAEFPFGNLYYNHTANCPPNDAAEPIALPADLGLSAENYRAYQNFIASSELLSAGAKFLNPFSNPSRLGREQQLTRWAAYLNAHQLSEGQRQVLFTLMGIWERMTYVDQISPDDPRISPLNDWRSSKLPEDLQAAGFDYLVYNSLWWGYLPEEERTIIETHYQPVGPLRDPINLMLYTLYAAPSSD